MLILRGADLQPLLLNNLKETMQTRYQSEKPKLQEGNGLANKLSRVKGDMSRYFRVFRRTLFNHEFKTQTW